MKSVTLELVASVRNPFPSQKRKEIVQYQETMTIGKLLLRVGFKSEELPHLIPIVNGSRTTQNYLLQDNDHIWITLPIGGG
jgi:hypothetical protein